MKISNRFHFNPLLIVCALSILWVTGCSRFQGEEGIEKDIERFYQHQNAFEQLANVACDVLEKLDTRFFRYPIDLQEEHSRFIEFTEIDTLLGTLNAGTIVMRQFEDIECSIFVSIHSYSGIGGGLDYGYRYQPKDLGLFEYTAGFFSEENVAYREANRVRGKEPVKFSIELASGWYLQYFARP
ncbi:MAG: hypothetical protein LAT53_09555 [Idiomarina sp.]|nr:hypothetical protein [Idiomarina sp.]